MPFSAFDDCNGSFTVALSIEENVFSIFILSNLNTLASGSFWEFSKKNAEKHMALRENISAIARVTDLVEMSKDTESILVCTRKKFFA